MEPKIMKIEQIVQQDENGAPQNYKQVTWELGDDGPFYYVCREVDFDPAHITELIKADAEKMGQLRAAFRSV